MAKRRTFQELGVHGMIASVKSGRTLPPKTNQPTKIMQVFLRAKRLPNAYKKKRSCLLTQPLKKHGLVLQLLLSNLDVSNYVSHIFLENLSIFTSI